MPANFRNPNVLFIMTDNQPADLLGCYGNDEIYTPHLDRLAQQGMRFDNAFCPNAMCSPSRASVLTGLMPSQHGIHTWLDDRVMDRWPTDWNAIAGLTSLPVILQAEGYRTALIGKYHVGQPERPQNGFEHWVTFPYGHTHSFWGNTFTDNGRRETFPGHSVDYLTDKAVAYIQAHDPAGQLAETHKLPISQARVHLAHGDAPAALAVLEPLRHQMEAKDWADEQLKVMVLQAVARHALGETEQAVQLLGDALTLAEPGGFIRLFVDEGPPMAELLREVAEHGAASNYVHQLLVAFGMTESRTPVTQLLSEPLTGTRA